MNSIAKYGQPPYTPQSACSSPVSLFSPSQSTICSTDKLVKGLFLRKYTPSKF